MSKTPPPLRDAQEPLPPSTLLPRLTLLEWVVFAALAALIAAANIYTTLLIGWGDTGSIVAVLAAVMVLGVLSKKKPTIYQLNLGQTMVSAGGGVGFAVASYAAIHIVREDWNPNPWHLVLLFSSAGILGALVGNLVRKQMVQYFFPSGTACAVIQRAVTEDRADGEPNRAVTLLKRWGLIAAALTIPGKIAFNKVGDTWMALVQTIEVKLGFARMDVLPIGSDPLFYGIGMVVGPRIGLGMIIGALLPSLWIVPMLEVADGGAHPWGGVGDWVKWIAIALLTLPTFAAIVFSYVYRVKVNEPPGFHPGRTRYTQPTSQKTVHGILLVLGSAGAALAGHLVFGLPWFATLATIAIAIPLSVVNGRVTGDTDINPVRLVAIVLISAFFWMVAGDAAVLLGMAVVGATVASVAVDMMQDMRTGHLLDQDHHHQTTVQFAGVLMGALASIPVLNVLVERLGVGEGTSLKAPGAQVWAAMAEAMAGGVEFSPQLGWGIAIASAVGMFYAWLTVAPATAKWMPSLFGLGIGMLVGLDAAMAIFLGGVIKLLVVKSYSHGREGTERETAEREGGDDTMVIGASVFAAGAILSILLVGADLLFGKLGWFPWHLAG